MTAAIPTATTPTNSVVRAPIRIWEKMSRPNLSVPSQCRDENPCSRSAALTKVGSYGVHT